MGIEMRSRAIQLVVVIACVTVSVACHKAGARVPDELIGSWTTDEPVYQGRSVKLEKDYVLIGFGEDVTPTVQRITQVHTAKLEKGFACTIDSADKEGPHQLTVFFNPAEGGFIYFKHLRGRWRRQ